jgi:DNA repair protein RadD
MDKPSITGDAVQHYLRSPAASAPSPSPSRSSTAATSRRSSRPRAFRRACRRQMAPPQRDAAVPGSSGETLILSNAELFGEGFDVPAIEAAILLRPTQVAVAPPAAGRPRARPCDGKARRSSSTMPATACATACPTMSGSGRSRTGPREEAQEAQPSEVPVRQCSKCFRVFRPAPHARAAATIPRCEPRRSRSGKGTLAEVDPAGCAARKQRSGGARLEDLIWSDRSERGYKPRSGSGRMAEHAARKRRGLGISLPTGGYG